MPILISTSFGQVHWKETIVSFLPVTSLHICFPLPDNNSAIEYPEWYGCLLAAWIFFGLAWLALLINHCIDLLEGLNAYLGKRKREQNEQTAEEVKEQTEKEPKVQET